MRIFLITICILFALPSVGQNNIVYKNLAAHINRAFTKVEKTQGIYRSIKDVSFHLSNILNETDAVKLSLRKMDTSGMEDPMFTLQLESLQIFLDNYEPDSSFYNPDLLVHFTKINNSYCYYLDSLYQTKNAIEINSDNVSKRLAYFYKDTLNVKELYTIIDTHKFRNKRFYEQNKMNTILFLARQCAIARKELLYQVFQQMKQL